MRERRASRKQSVAPEEHSASVGSGMCLGTISLKNAFNIFF